MFISSAARLGWLGSTRGTRADHRPELETDDADVSCGFGGVFLLFVNRRKISVLYRRQELNRIEVLGTSDVKVGWRRRLSGWMAWWWKEEGVT